MSLSPNSRILVIVLVSIVLVVLIYSLPKVVVSDDETDLEGETTTEEVHIHGEMESGGDIPDEEQLKELKQKFREEDNSGEKMSWGVALAELYIRLDQLDSAYWVARKLRSEGYVDESGFVKSRVFYRKMVQSTDQAEAARFADSAESTLLVVLEKDENDLGSKNMMAEVYLNKGEVMKSVMMLKEIVETDPDNSEAQFQLGILSVQSGQLDKAVERFSKVISTDSTNVKAYYWLGYSLVNSDRGDEALPVIEKARTMTDDPEVITALESLVENI